VCDGASDSANMKSSNYKTCSAAQAVTNVLADRRNSYCSCCRNLRSPAFWVRVIYGHHCKCM